MSYVFWAAVAVCAVAQLFIVAAAVRANAPDRADGVFPRSSRAIEIGWTIIPAIGLALLLLFTHRALEPAQPGSSTSPRSSAGVAR